MGARDASSSGVPIPIDLSHGSKIGGPIPKGAYMTSPGAPIPTGECMASPKVATLRDEIVDGQYHEPYGLGGSGPADPADSCCSCPRVTKLSTGLSDGWPGSLISSCSGPRSTYELNVGDPVAEAEVFWGHWARKCSSLPQIEHFMI